MIPHGSRNLAAFLSRPTFHILVKFKLRFPDMSRTVTAVRDGEHINRPTPIDFPIVLQVARLHYFWYYRALTSHQAPREWLQQRHYVQFDFLGELDR